MEEQKDSPMRSREDVVNLTGVNLKQTLSETIVEYPNVELCPRLAKEGRELFAHVIAASTDTDQLDRLGRVASRHGVRKQPEASNVIIGWQRYSVDFGKGRMGLEFEYDTREIRRLVVTCVTKEASALGVCARDILIGIGNRIVPRATDPLAVHRHLIECALLCRSPSEFIIPALRMDPARYGVDDEGRSIHAEARCLLNEGARLVLVRALKPLLRPKPWELIYDSACDGMCLSALYANAGAAKSSQAQLIVCRDDHGHVAGAFLDEPIRNVGNYFGTGECFVFTVAGKSGPAAAEADVLPDPDMAIYRWVGPTESIPASALASTRGDLISEPRPFVNDMFVYTTHEVLGFGSGGGGFALRLDEAIEFGASRPCATYGNPVSLFGGRENFPIERVQIWHFAAQF
mmetsp:Transcript_3862/g.12616  ORF Transcript_3862/g.12616 Transcript_3862/m.12616 type:complete len:404 (-) Transcript_3862:417-1628(-)